MNLSIAPAPVAATRGSGSLVDGRRGRSSALPQEQFINEIDDALIELLERNPLLSEAGVEIDRVSCGSVATGLEAEQQRIKGRDEKALTDRALDTRNKLLMKSDDFESGLYLCRWPNGEFSVVKADTKREAILQLDEWAGAEPAWLVPMETCMIDFRLNNRAAIELGEFGEETAGFIWDICYPELDALLSRDDVIRHRIGKCNPKIARKIRRAIQHEGTRLWNTQRDGVPVSVIPTPSFARAGFLID